MFTVATSKVAFEGFRTVYTEADEEKEVSNVLVNGLSMDSELTKEEFDTKQHFTQPPAHYTEATLVKALEELGIGRRVPMHQQSPQFSEDVILPKKPRICISQRSEK